MSSRFAFRRNPKFTLGTSLTDPQQVVDACKSGNWLYFGAPPYRRRVYHPAWIGNMNFSCVMAYVRSGQLAYALRNPEYPYVFVAKWMGREPWDKDEKQGEWFATCTELPLVRITAFTKDSVCSESEKAAVEATGQRQPRIKVRFELKEENKTPIALLR